jgi:hypothetical protein
MDGKMKTLRILVSQNGWEYSGLVTLNYYQKYELKRSHENSYDSEGKECPDTIVLDSIYAIGFDEGIEVLK